MELFLLMFIVCGVGLLTYDVDALPEDWIPIVSTSNGKVQGSAMRTRLGLPIFAYRGIRYGKPPVGDLRFRAPEPVEPWSDVFDATEDGPMCMQFRWDGDYSDMSEDCLRLNVYSDNTSVYDHIVTEERKPVIAYMHPGAFIGGTAQSSYSGPQYLMDRDIVLVTLNYRLSSFGMLAAGNKNYPGNAGLKDQVLALKWIKDNIAQFGGDPDNVTIMGCSAGAMSVTLHMVSPMSKGLFHRAIAMSGAATAQWKVPPHQINLIEKQAGFLNCSNPSVDSMIMCMKSLSAINITKTVNNMYEFGGLNPILVWYPVVEPDFGQERFLTDDPTTLFQRGHFHRVPVMAGITELELGFLGTIVMEQPDLRQKMDTNFYEIAPICFLYERDTDRSEFISNELRNSFLRDPPVNNRSIGLEQLFADGVIGFGVHRFVQLASEHTDVFYYKNSYVGRFTNFYFPGENPISTVHTDDLMYLFVSQYIPIFGATDPENLQVERMTRLMANFASQGTPNNKYDEILTSMSWQPMITDRFNYLSIGQELEMRQDLFIHRYNVWNRLFSLNRKRTRYLQYTFESIYMTIIAIYNFILQLI